MHKSTTVAFGVVLLATSVVLWWFVEVGLPVAILIGLVVALLVGTFLVFWRRAGDNESGGYTVPSGGYRSPPRFEETPRRAVSSQWPTREISAKSSDQQLEAVVSWLASMDDRLKRIEAHLARQHETPRTASGTFAEQHPQPMRHRSEDVANRVLDSSHIKSDFVQIACQAYRKLAREGLRDLPLEPVFVVLDIDSSAQTSAIEEVRRNFRQSKTKQSEFIVFQKNSTEAWLFPNPRISFTEAMKYVFPYLTYENFEGVTDAIAPERVRQTSPETWEMVTDGRQ